MICCASVKVMMCKKFVAMTPRAGLVACGEYISISNVMFSLRYRLALVDGLVSREQKQRDNAEQQIDGIICLCIYRYTTFDLLLSFMEMSQ